MPVFGDLNSLSVADVLLLVDKMWYAKYERLSPIMKSLKKADAPYSSTYSQLCFEVGRVKKYIANFMVEITRTFEAGTLGEGIEDKLYAIYAHCQVCQGDLERYLDTYRQPPLIAEEQFKQSIDLYMSAVLARPEYGKAYSGLFLVAAQHQFILRSVVYLVKSAIVADPFAVNSKTIFPKLVESIRDNPSKLKDVPIPARSCVANCLALIALHAVGGVPEQSDAGKSFLRLIHQSMPSKDVIDVAAHPLLPHLDWDTLLVILLIEAVKTRMPADLLEVLRILIGRALSLRRVLPLAACMEFALETPSMVAVVSAIKAQALTTITRPELNVRMAEAALPMDHLLGGGRGSNDKFEMTDIASARICQQCQIPWGTAPARKTEIIVDGANVACRAGEGRREADVQGILSVYTHWTSRGFPVKVFVSDRHAQRSRANRPSATKSGISINLDEIFKLLPESGIVTVPAQNYDDSYMIQHALNVDGLIVSNDMYRDWSTKTGNPGYAESWAKSHLITYTFVDGIFLPNPDFKMPIPWPNRLEKISRC